MDKEGNLLMDQNGKPNLKCPILESSCYTHTCSLVCYVLPVVDDSDISVRRFRAVRVEVGELELDPLLYVFIRRTILSGSNYQLASYFPDIPDAYYRDKFLDFASPDGFTTLSSGIFWWLINIRPRSVSYTHLTLPTIYSV